MSKRSLSSLYVTKYKSLYAEMSNQDLAEELDALGDQLVALMMVSNSTSIEIMYDRDFTLKIFYQDHRDEKQSKIRNSMN